jgi:Tol biopolymer transport system component
MFWPRTRTDAPPKLVALTTMTGHSMWPTFSPDGEQVAFAWQPEGQDNFDIYVKLVGGQDVRRLTTDPADDDVPSWSPDGQQIAFVRSNSDFRGAIHLVSPIGGGERKLSDFPVIGAIAWSPDGRYIAAERADPAGVRNADRRIYLLPVDGSEGHPITAGNGQGPSFSPDGRRLAFVTCDGGDCPIDVLDLDSEFRPTGRSRRLMAQAPFMTWGVTWSPDASSVIYGALEGGGPPRLWRVPIDGTRPPQRIEIPGVDGAFPAIAARRGRLAFSHSLNAQAPYRFEPGRRSEPLLRASFFEGNLSFSPDGHRVAYCADAGEAMEVWTANADGSTPQQLTHRTGRWQCGPRWSPDGKQIAFDSQARDGDWHIWRIAADGGAPTQLTMDQGSQNNPSWSRDGRSIYYTANQGNGLDIWRVGVGDGRKQRVTDEGDAWRPDESGDGSSVVYNVRGALHAVPVTGGRPRQIVSCVTGWAAATRSANIYYAACGAGMHRGWAAINPALHVINVVTGRDRVLGTLEKLATYSGTDLAVPPDETFVVYDRLLREGHDLMLIENFR